MLRVSVLELPARWDAVGPALAEVDQLLGGGPPVDLVVLPEMALTGYVSPEADFDLARFAEPLDGPTIQRVAGIAERHRTSIVAPLVLEEGGARFNAAVVVGPDGRTVAVYRKRHPWFPERWATPGAEPHPLLRIGELTITIAICYDGHFLEDEAADVLARADLLVFTSAWVDEEDSRLPLLRGLARRFGVSIANANWSEGVVVVPGQGASCILDARGTIVASAGNGEPRSRRMDALIPMRTPAG